MNRHARAELSTELRPAGFSDRPLRPLGDAGAGDAGGATTGGGVDIVGTIDWYIDGNPPCSTNDPLAPPIDLNYLVTNCSSAN